MESKNNTPNKNKIRHSVLILAGVYLIYQAWQIFRNAKAPDNTMPLATSYLFTVIFGAVGTVIIVRSLIRFKNMSQEDSEARREAEQAKRDAERAKAELLHRDLSTIDAENQEVPEEAAGDPEETSL